MFFPPIPLIRKKRIIKKLREAGAFSPETSVTLADAGVINSNAFRCITERLIQSGVITPFENGRFYLDEKR